MGGRGRGISVRKDAVGRAAVYFLVEGVAICDGLDTQGSSRAASHSKGLSDKAPTRPRESRSMASRHSFLQEALRHGPFKRAFGST